MNIIYVANARIPTPKAYGVNMIKTCEALVKGGANLTLIAPRRKDALTESIFSYYGIPEIFSVTYTPIFDAVSRNMPYGFWFNQITFSLSVVFSLLKKHFFSKSDIVIVTRDEMTGWFLRKCGYKVFYDMHGFPENKRWFWKVSLRSMCGIFATNRWKIEQCVTLFGIPRKKIVHVPNGFDETLFHGNINKNELRRKLNLPQDAKIVMYTGSFLDWKGAHVLLETALRSDLEERSGKGLTFVFVGGNEEELRKFREKAKGFKNILFLGHKPYYEIPDYLKAADVLVLPNSKHSKEKRFSVYSQKDTSPIKLFEYMASGVPIIASDLPSIREIVNNEEVTFFESDNPNALKKAIEEVLKNKEKILTITENAKSKSEKYTWKSRGQEMLSFIKENICLKN